MILIVGLTTRDKIVDEVRRHAQKCRREEKRNNAGGHVLKYLPLYSTSQWGSMSWRIVSRQGACKSRGRTFIVGQATNKRGIIPRVREAHAAILNQDNIGVKSVVG